MIFWLEVSRIESEMCRFDGRKAQALLQTLFDGRRENHANSNIFCQIGICTYIHICLLMWKKRNFTLTLFWQKFRQNNGFTNEITK